MSFRAGQKLPWNWHNSIGDDCKVAIASRRNLIRATVAQIESAQRHSIVRIVNSNVVVAIDDLRENGLSSSSNGQTGTRTGIEFQIHSTRQGESIDDDQLFETADVGSSAA